MPARPDDFRYEPGFLTADAARQLTERVEALEYQHDSFRGQRLRRGSAQFGYAYVSTGRKVVTVDPVPAFLITVIERALPLCPPDTHFNQCIVTKYPAGAGIGWHTDAVCFAGTIVGVSLGAEARLAFRHNGGEEVCYRLVVSPGALYVMSGSARWDHQHKVEPVRATRFSLRIRRQTTESNSPPTPRRSPPAAGRSPRSHWRGNVLVAPAMPSGGHRGDIDWAITFAGYAIGIHRQATESKRPG